MAAMTPVGSIIEDICPVPDIVRADMDAAVESARAAVGLPVSAPILALTVFAAVLIWIRHHENIARLLKGQEPRIGAKKA